MHQNQKAWIKPHLHLIVNSILFTWKKKYFQRQTEKSVLSGFFIIIIFKDFNIFKNSSQEWKCNCFLIQFQL